MIFDPKPKVGRKGRLTRQVSLAFLGLIASFDAASAQPPTGCNLNTLGGPANTLGPGQLPFYQSLPGSQYFTNAGNTVAGSSTPASGTSISAVEASTSVVTELVAGRRVQEAMACSVGYEKVGGVCQPVRTRTASERRYTPKPSSMTSISGTAPSQTASPSRQQGPQFQTEAQPERLTSNAVWSEAFYDYENRSGLGTALAPASRTQQTSELLFGGDHTFRSGDTQLIVGALGSISSIKQTFSSSSNVVQNTSYSAPVTDNFGVTTNFDYVLPASHSINSQEDQTLKGGGGGLTASITHGGLFADGLFKSDFLNLNRNSLSSDTYPTQLSAVFNNVGPQLGCINVGYPGNSVGPPTFPMFNPNLFATPYNLTSPQAFFKALSQGTTNVNFVLAESIGYHFAIGPSTWVEPLVGGSYTYSAYGSNAAALGLQNGQDIRLQAGARVGAATLTDRGILTASFAQIIYSDVYIHGYVTNADGFSAGYLLADQGKIRGQSIATAKMNLPNGFSFFLQCQARYGNDYWAYGGRVGARYDF
jgi:hypothetical protein